MHASEFNHNARNMASCQNHSKTKLRIVFMGSPEFAIPCLDRLTKTHDVWAVYSQPAKKSGRGMKINPMPVAHHALKAGLPLFTPDNLKSAKIEAQLASLIKLISLLLWRMG